LIRSGFLRAAAIVAALLILTGCGKSDGAQDVQFDGGRAYEILKKQCSFGPRYPNTPGHDKMVEYLQAELKPLSDGVTVHSFTYNTGKKELEIKNICAVFNPDASEYVLLCAHWDTRPWADEEIDQAKRNLPVPGANDGASGVAVLLELARMFHIKRPSVGVIMVFFDGEDYGPSTRDMFIGSTRFAKEWRTALKPIIKRSDYKIKYGILLDMVGDSSLQLPRERKSMMMAGDIVDKVWAVARKAGYGNIFTDTGGYSIADDHVPLNMVGIKCIDIIDFDYAYWHTIEDTPDKCSAKSLQIVGEVVSKVVYEESVQAK
jgi:glutaminyl-peptide cyclotransferase